MALPDAHQTDESAGSGVSARSDVVLAESGVGYRQHRIPALVATPRGTLIAAFDGRPDLDDLPGPIDLVVRRSRDGGRSWSAPAVARAASGLTGYGDPSLLADADTGRVLCFHAAGTAVGFFESGDGEADDDPALLHCDLLVSDDHGRSWTVRRLTAMLRRDLNAALRAGIPPGVEAPRVAGLFAASGAGTQLRHGPHRGRLLQGFVALVRRDGAPHLYAVVARSDDGGLTWRTSDPVGPGANETALAALPDGRVLLHSRAPGRRLAAWSPDGGATFGPLRPVPDLPDPGNNGSLLALGSGALLASHTTDPDLRRALVLSVSRDDGRSWAPAISVTAAGAGYSVLAPLPGDGVGVLWEDEGYRRLVFTAFAGPGGGTPDGEPLDAAGNPTSDPSCRDDALGRDEPASPPIAAAARGPALVLDHVLPARPRDWRDVGESRDVTLATDQFSSAVFKIVGDEDGVQRVATREAYELNLGPLRPGLGAGDILVCSARLPLPTKTPTPAPAATPAPPLADAPTVRWEGGTHPAQRHTDADGDRLLARGLRHIVTEAEVAAGVVRLRVELAADADADLGGPERAHASLDVPIHCEKGTP